MELAAEKLEVLVLQAEITLDTILLDLDKELTNQAGVQLRPSYLINTIQEMQSELAELKKDSDAVIQKQEEVKCQLDKELQMACRKIQNLQNKTGYKSIRSNTAGSALKTHFDKLNM